MSVSVGEGPLDDLEVPLTCVVDGHTDLILLTIGPEALNEPDAEGIGASLTTVAGGAEGDAGVSEPSLS